MTNEKIIIQGGGDHARVVLDCLLGLNHHVIAVFDPKYDSGNLFGVPHRGKYDPSFEPSARAVIAIGDNGIRKKVAADCRHQFVNVIDRTAVVSPRATAGVGNMILHGVIVQAVARIGDHVILNTGSRIDHDCVIGSFAHIGPGATLCGTVEVGEGAFIGAGSTIIPGRKIGQWAVVGAGSVVIDDIPEYAVAVGNPARVIRLAKA